ncbi:MAG: hypothetical protein GWM98_19425 [Nitrospinaceae bacterium]|nr:hypothetical protein [Nitrospinaceae bacterium]NIR56258.1 hypothetical protein [Nitrospinaceae bacterium]NIS86714.1 hypothetical protein [Nitrospinaceae bacterium]NIT83547.1 hypothetical protein [Nitrospinaceae bacterium]NIU45752.1 hypothetical protein [Nitrospinaceae bacterium]
MTADRNRIDKEKDSLKDLNSKVEKLLSLSQGAEDKIALISGKVGELEEMEQRLLGLNIMSEDVKVKIDNLRKESDSINQVGQQIAELKFLLKEIDKRRESME